MITFGRHIQRGTKHGGSEVIITKEFSESEISDFDVSIMFENIGEFKISVHDFIFDKCFESIENLYEEFDCLILSQILLFFLVLHEISFIAVFKDEVEIIGCLLDVIEFYDVFIITCTQHAYLVFEKFVEFSLQ